MPLFQIKPQPHQYTEHDIDSPFLHTILLTEEQPSEYQRCDVPEHPEECSNDRTKASYEESIYVADGIVENSVHGSEQVEIPGSKHEFLGTSRLEYHDAGYGGRNERTDDKVSDGSHFSNYPNDSEGLHADNCVNNYDRFPILRRMESTTVEKLSAKQNDSTKHGDTQRGERSFPVEKESGYDGQNRRDIPKNLKCRELLVPVELHDLVSAVMHSDTQEHKQ